MTVAEELAVGLTHLRGAFYYKETKRRWGANFPNCLLGQAEAKFMTKLPSSIDGARLLPSILARNDAKFPVTRQS